VARGTDGSRPIGASRPAAVPAVGDVTGWLKDASGSYVLAMFVVARRGEIGADENTAPAAVHTGH
jgi:hypothetical protein